MVLENQTYEYLYPEHLKSPASRHRPLQIKVLRLGTFRRLQVCAECVHVIERLCEESPAGVDLHEGQVIQLGTCLLLPHKAAGRHLEFGMGVSHTSLICFGDVV